MPEDSFIQFLSELKANRKSKTIDEMVDRLAAENDLRKFLNELKTKGFLVQESLDESLDFDFLIRKDDLELVGLFEYGIDEFKLSFEKLKDINRILSSTVQSRAILLVWIVRPDYPSVLLDPYDLNKRIRTSENEYDFRLFAKPMRESVELFFKKPASMISGLPYKKEVLRQAERQRICDVFRQILSEEFKEVKTRKFRLEHKIKAAEELSNYDVQRIESVFGLALDNKLEKDNLERILREVSQVR